MKTNCGYIIASVRCYPSCKHLRKVNFVFLDLTYPGPEASLSALQFSLDLGSDGNRRCYTYSVQLAVEGFFFVCALFSSCFFILKWSESKHEAIVYRPSPYRERNKMMLFVFISFQSITVLFSDTFAPFFAPYFNIMFGEKISSRQQFFNSHQNWSQNSTQIKSSFSLRYAYVSTACYLGEGMAQCSHDCGLGSIRGPGVTCWLNFSLVLFLVPRVFLRVLWFPPSTKTNILNSNSTWKQWTRRANSWKAHC